MNIFSFRGPRGVRLFQLVTDRSLVALKEGLNKFTFAANGKRVLPVSVPFTINTNGAWVSLKAPAEGVMKDGRIMLPGARRRKAAELATSINTYVDLAKTGIFD